MKHLVIMSLTGGKQVMEVKNRQVFDDIIKDLRDSDGHEFIYVQWHDTEGVELSTYTRRDSIVSISYTEVE